MGIQDHGARWACLVEHDEMLFENWLPTATQTGTPWVPREPGELAVGETIGLVAPPDALLATMVVIAGVADDDGSPRHVGVSAYPFATDGVRHRLIIRAISPWEGDLEGWLTVAVPGSDITFTFFDTCFHANRDRYRIGEAADFLLAGLAYGAFVDHREALELEGRRVELKGAAMLAHHDEADPDEYDFLAPVSAAEPDAMGPFPLTRVTATLLRVAREDGDHLLDIDLFVPDKCWRTDERPKPGDDLSGVLWLQGRLAD